MDRMMQPDHKASGEDPQALTRRQIQHYAQAAARQSIHWAVI